MATVLRVNLTNQYGDSKNINIKNPTANQTLSNITTQFATILNNHVLLAGSQPLTAVKSAKTIVTTETQIY